MLYAPVDFALQQHQRRSQTVGRFLAPNATPTAPQQQLQPALQARLHPAREPLTTEIHRGGQPYQNQEPQTNSSWLGNECHCGVNMLRF